MAQTTSDNLQLNAAKALDNRTGVLQSGVWRPYNDIAEYNSLRPAPGRYENELFWVRSTTNSNRSDLYALRQDKTPYKVLEDVDFSNFYTKGEIDTIITALESAVLSVQNNLDNEVARAINAENTLQSNIDNETSSRQSADDLLGQQLSTETNARISGDNTLQQNINKSQLNVSTTITATEGQTEFIFSELIGQFPKIVLQSKSNTYTVGNTPNDTLGYVQFDVVTGKITVPVGLSAGETLKVLYTATGNAALVPDTVVLESEITYIKNVVEGGEFIKGQADNTYSLDTLGSNGIRGNVNPFLYDGWATKIEIWASKAGVVEYKLIRINEDGNYEQYFSYPFICVLGLNTFIGGIDYVTPRVFEGGLDASYGATSGTGLAGRKTVTNASYLFSSANSPNGTVFATPVLSNNEFGIKTTYQITKISKRVASVEELTDDAAYPILTNPTTGYPAPPTELNKAVDSTTGALVDNSEYDLTKISLVPGERLRFESIDGSTISIILGLEKEDGTPLPRLAVPPLLTNVTREVTIPAEAVIGYYYNRERTPPTSSIFKIKITFLDRNEVVGISRKDGESPYLFSDASGGSKKPMPDGGFEVFQVDVNCAIPGTGQGQSPQDSSSVYSDYGVVKFPYNYKDNYDPNDPDSGPFPLLIACHGTGTWIDEDSTFSTISEEVSEFWASQGFVVMDMNGIPSAFVGGDDTRRHFGAPFALQSYLKGYEYITSNYNVDPNCFVYGVSMGGLSSNMIVQSGSIPVRAHGGFAPCTDLFKQAYCNPWFTNNTQRRDICRYFGFEGTEPIFTTNKPPTTAEIDYFIANLGKVVGYNPMLKNIPNLGVDTLVPNKPLNTVIRETIYKTIPNPPQGTSITTLESEDYYKFSKIHPVPVKFWHNLADATVTYRYSKFFIEMCKRGGCLAEIRLFDSYINSPHDAWTNGDIVTGIPTVVTGVTTQIRASQYEMLQFFLRFWK